MELLQSGIRECCRLCCNEVKACNRLCCNELKACNRLCCNEARTCDKGVVMKRELVTRVFH